jgi:hypothetical protein
VKIYNNKIKHKISNSHSSHLSRFYGIIIYIKILLFVNIITIILKNYFIKLCKFNAIKYLHYEQFYCVSRVLRLIGFFIEYLNANILTYIFYFMYGYIVKYNIFDLL